MILRIQGVLRGCISKTVSQHIRIPSPTHLYGPPVSMIPSPWPPSTCTDLPASSHILLTLFIPSQGFCTCCPHMHDCPLKSSASPDPLSQVFDDYPRLQSLSTSFYCFISSSCPEIILVISCLFFFQTSIYLRECTCTQASGREGQREGEGENLSRLLPECRA